MQDERVKIVFTLKDFKNFLVSKSDSRHLRVCNFTILSNYESKNTITKWELDVNISSSTKEYSFVKQKQKSTINMKRKEICSNKKGIWHIKLAYISLTHLTIPKANALNAAFHLQYTVQTWNTGQKHRWAIQAFRAPCFIFRLARCSILSFIWSMWLDCYDWYRNDFFFML